ncbi:hypothetical protein, partial [Streptomyces sp. NPDC059742]|uniref:hypothetical protein n=1 Tax=Streptomyces sp. NPDC059742 TaxID=3346927 RepID=UPI00364D6D69
MTAESCFRIASLTKAFTSLALVRTLRDDRVPQRTPVVELPDLGAGGGGRAAGPRAPNTGGGSGPAG